MVNLVVGQNQKIIPSLSRKDKRKKKQRYARYPLDMVVVNNKVLTTAQDVTKKGVISLYNNGLIPKHGGRVSSKSKFAKSGHSHKLYSEI